MTIESITMNDKISYGTNQQLSHNSKMENNILTVYIQNTEIRTETPFFIQSPKPLYILLSDVFNLNDQCITTGRVISLKCVEYFNDEFTYSVQYYIFLRFSCWSSYILEITHLLNEKIGHRSVFLTR